MKSRELTRQHTKLKSLISKARAASASDFEAQSHWAKYICVLVAGFLENSISQIYSEYCQKCANQNVANFSREVLSRIRNPKTDRFLEVAGAFSESWASQLQAYLENGGRKEAVNSIMGNRHLIAHGKDSGISLVRVKDYLDKSVEMLEFIEKQCGL